MMDRIGLAVAALALMASTAALAFDAKEDTKRLEGTWQPMSGEYAGDKFPDDTLKMTKLVIKDGSYTVKIGETTDTGTLTLDADKRPKTLDIVGTQGPNKDKTILAIYDVGEDTLKICYALDGKERPKEFKTKEGTKLLLITYQRQKP